MTHVFFCVSKNVSVSCAYTQGKREQFSGFNRTLDAINNVFRKFSAFHDETGRLNVDGMNIISNDGSNKLNRSRKVSQLYVFMPPNLGGFFMVRSYYPSECHADYFDFERIEALKPAIEACGISTLSQSPMLGFHKQMDNRIKLLEEILSFRMQGVEFD